MDPHGNSQAQTQVKVGAAVLVEVILQLVSVCSDVQRDKGDAAGQRVGLLSPLNEGLVQVKAQEKNFVHIRFFFTHRLLHQMLVKGDTQFLPFTKKKEMEQLSFQVMLNSLSTTCTYELVQQLYNVFCCSDKAL